MKASHTYKVAFADQPSTSDAWNGMYQESGFPTGTLTMRSNDICRIRRRIALTGACSVNKQTDSPSEKWGKLFWRSCVQHRTMQCNIRTSLIVTIELVGLIFETLAPINWFMQPKTLYGPGVTFRDRPQPMIHHLFRNYVATFDVFVSRAASEFNKTIKKWNSSFRLFGMEK